MLMATERSGAMLIPRSSNDVGVSMIDLVVDLSDMHPQVCRLRAKIKLVYRDTDKILIIDAFPIEVSWWGAAIKAWHEEAAPAITSASAHFVRELLILNAIASASLAQLPEWNNSALEKLVLSVGLCTSGKTNCMADSSWALSRISKLLPLDDDSLSQILDHSSSLSPEDAAENFKNLLGDSPQALEFITSFNSRRNAPSSASQPGAVLSSSSADAPPARRTKKKKPGIRDLPAPRRVDNAGDVQGAYHKKDIAEDYMPASRSSRKDATAPNTFSLSSTPAARQLPTPASHLLDPSMPNIHSRTASPAKSSRAPTPTATSRTSSPKPSKSSKSTKVTIAGGAAMHGASSTLSDLESAIRALELSTNPTIPSNDPAVRRCPCMGTTHPLLTAAPNCISCGKIVCAKEGLAPCTFCGAPLLTPDQVQGMVQALREERGREKMALNNAGQRKADVSTTARPFQGSSSGAPQPQQQQKQKTEALEKAQAHRDRLLGFQATNAARTKVVDEAASYETPDSGVSQWGSAEERAAQFKKQQRILREVEWNAKPEYEKRRMVVSVDLVGRKVVKKMGEVDRPQDVGVEDDDEASSAFPHEYQVNTPNASTSQRTAGGAFSRNPLLGKLIRPKWKDDSDAGIDVGVEGTDKGKGKGAEKAPRQRNQLWRRVQDDADDNEEYILNGGVYGGREQERIIAEEPACG